MKLDEKKILIHLGQRIQKMRIYNGFSLPRLAKCARISKGTLSEIENGNTNPTVLTLYRITKAMKVRFWRDHLNIGNKL